MPYTLRPCLHPGCPELVRSGRCVRHQTEEQARQGSMRDPTVQRLYDRRWQARRKRQLARQPWCEDCLEIGLYISAIDVHHEVRHRGDPMVFLKSPLRSLCHACHSKRTVKEVGIS